MRAFSRGFSSAIAVFAAAIFLFSAAPVRADMIVQSVTLTTGTESLNKFDPSLGALDSISYDLTFHGSNTAFTSFDVYLGPTAMDGGGIFVLDFIQNCTVGTTCSSEVTGDITPLSELTAPPGTVDVILGSDYALTTYGVSGNITYNYTSNVSVPEPDSRIILLTAVGLLVLIMRKRSRQGFAGLLPFPKWG